MPWYRRGSSSFNRRPKTSSASANWRYITKEDQEGARSDERVMSTMEAKKQYQLTTSDICGIQGLRHKGSYSTRTLYYVNDLRAASVAKHGEDHFLKKTKAGRLESGVEGKERAEKDARKMAKSKFPYLPLKFMHELPVYKINEIIKRYGGSELPNGSPKSMLVDAAKRAGYSFEEEKKYQLGKKEKADLASAESKRYREEGQTAEVDKYRAKQRRQLDEAKRKDALFNAGKISLDEMCLSDLKWQLRKRRQNVSGNLPDLKLKIAKLLGISITDRMKTSSSSSSDDLLQKKRSRNDDIDSSAAGRKKMKKLPLP